MADFQVIGKTELDSSGFATGVAGMAKTGAKVIGAGVAAMSAAIGAGVAAATAYGSAFESAVAKVSTLVDTASPQGVQALENLEASFLKTSTATGQTAEALAEAGYQALSAGVSAQSAGAFVETAAKLATGGFTQTASAVDVLSTAINAYGLEEKDAQHISDALIQTQNLGKTTVDELAGSLGRVAPSAAAYKVSMEDTLAALAQMTKGGISTAESTTYLKGMLNELAKEGSKVSGILKDETGASFSELMEQGYSLGDVMQILGDSVDGDATAFANLWSSQEAGTGALSILNQGTADYNETLRSITDSAGASESAFGKMMDTFESKMGILKTSAQNLGIAVYQGLQGPMAQMAEVAIGYVQTLADAFEQNGPAGLISALGTVLGDLVGRAAELAPTVIELAVGLLDSLIAGIGELLPTLATAASDILTALCDGVFQLLPDIVIVGGQLIVSLAQGIAEALPQIALSAIETLTAFYNYIFENLPQMLEAGKNILSNVISGILQSLPGILSAAGNLISTMVTGILTNLPQILESGRTILGNVVTGLQEALPQIIEAAGRLIVTMVTGIVQNLPQIIESGIKLIVSLVQGIGEALPDIITAAGEVVSQIWDTITETDWLQLGADIMSGLISGIGSMAGLLWDACVNIAKSALDAIKSFFGIKSPSRVMREQVGKMLPRGMAAGIDADADEVEASMRRLAGDGYDALRAQMGRMTAGLQWTGGPELAGVPGRVALAGASAAGPVTNYYTATIDAKNVREWNDVVKVFQRHEAVVRQGYRR